MPVDFSPWSQGTIRLALAAPPQTGLIVLGSVTQHVLAQARSDVLVAAR